ncbi:MAG: cysteine hydrolase [Chloroflexi bacterium]|nr:cysteine hydrolase [Chloroflexota bacterium]
MTRTAVLVIDMIREFCDPENGLVYIQNADRIVPPLHEFVTEARAAGILIIWIIDQHRPNKPDFELDRVRFHCTEGSPGVELMPPLQALAEDYVVTKSRYSAFFATDLDLILRNEQVNRLALTGTKTNVCVRAAAQDAFARNYDLLIPRELVTTDRENLHWANLEDMERYFGRVLPAAEVLALLREESTLTATAQHA